jgi:glutamine synthetase
MVIIAEYIWIDGSTPTQKLRSKTKIVNADIDLSTDGAELELSLYEGWQFDGSSTSQADGNSSDCLLRPVRIYPDPIRGLGAVLVLCEVDLPNHAPHPSNARAQLCALLDQGAIHQDAWFGYEQEYTLYQGSRPLGFPTDGGRFPPAQGPYYCGVGADEVYGRDLVEAHMNACLVAGLSLCGINAEVMPGQWEFQIGGPNAGPLKSADDLWIARWLLYRLGEDFGLTATLDPKPVPGDWNGAGMHTNFSTTAMREDGGRVAIDAAIEQFASHIFEHLAVYGWGYEMRLTGHHETCRYDEFKAGVSDRTASIRIPANVERDGCGYLEDRRPNANADPYGVARVILQSICGLHK